MTSNQLSLEHNLADFRDVLDKLQEECAEVIQAAAKTKSYGLHDAYSGKTNKEHLTTEIGDVLCLITILVANGIVDPHEVEAARIAKGLKMQTWAPTVAKYFKG